MKDYAKRLYKSKQWQHTRDAYLKSKGGLCERCYAEGRIVPAAIVHHKIYISPENIDNPFITLDWNNLEAICREHHAQEHELGHKHPRRYIVGDNGKIIPINY